MDVKETSRHQCDVALVLTKQLLQNEGKSSNVVLSPLSIHVILSMIAAGSKGPPLDQLLSFLKSKSSKHLNAFVSEIAGIVFLDGTRCGGPRLAFVNGAWIDQSLPFKHSFKQIVDTAYKARLSQVDFKTKAVEVASEVNSWAEKETKGLIQDLLPPDSVNSLTKLIFANALYFKGNWAQKFDASETIQDKFHLLDGSSVQVPFLTSQNVQYLAAFDGFKVLKLLYKRGSDKRSFSMCFFLPNAKNGLTSLINKLDSQPGFLDSHIPREKIEVGTIWIPKFKIAFGVEASAVLKGLGLVLPFTEGGLLEMVDFPLSQELIVSKIFHKSFIEVNEEGTEAAAASAARMVAGCSLYSEEKMKLDFVADHPFLFFIRENHKGALLFSGQLLNPLTSD